jgi:hypothetical protein
VIFIIGRQLFAQHENNLQKPLRRRKSNVTMRAFAETIQHNPGNNREPQRIDIDEPGTTHRVGLHSCVSCVVLLPSAAWRMAPASIVHPGKAIALRLLTQA